MKAVKIVTGISLLIFTVVCTSLILAGYWNRKYSQDRWSIAKNEVTDSLEQNVKGMQILLTNEEVAKHATLDDCWMIVEGSIYNFSPFLVLHPGGADVMIKFCGKDGSIAFATQDTNPPGKHSTVATKMLSEYYLGSLGDTVTVDVEEMTPSAPTQINASPSVTPIPSTAISTTSSVSLTMAEVSKHNNSSNCWLLITGKVYDVTGYISSHPGGSRDIINNCGTDATNAFATQGGGGTHSSFASSLLANYLIGNLNTTVASSQAPIVSNTTITTSGTSVPNGDPDLPAAVKSKYPGATIIKGKYEDGGEWEGKVNVSGTCRTLKVSNSGIITEDKSC